MGSKAGSPGTSISRTKGWQMGMGAWTPARVLLLWLGLEVLWNSTSQPLWAVAGQVTQGGSLVLRLPGKIEVSSCLTGPGCLPTAGSPENSTSSSQGLGRGMGKLLPAQTWLCVLGVSPPWFLLHPHPTSHSLQSIQKAATVLRFSPPTFPRATLFSAQTIPSLASCLSLSHSVSSPPTPAQHRPCLPSSQLFFLLLPLLP